jgi:S-adenosylmethionine synthetase
LVSISQKTAFFKCNRANITEATEIAYCNSPGWYEDKVECGMFGRGNRSIGRKSVAMQFRPRHHMTYLGSNPGKGQWEYGD